MLEAAVGAVWSGARGWLTPPVLFVLMNLVIGTIAIMSRLMSSAATTDGGDQRSLMRAPSAAFDRLRCFSFSRLGVPAVVVDPAFGDGAAEDAAPDGGEWRRASLLRAPSVALDRLRSFSFSRRCPAAAADAPVTPSTNGATEVEPLQPPAEAEIMEREQAGIERSQSEAAAEAPPARRRRGPRARRTRNKSGSEERLGTAAELATAGSGEEAGAGRDELPPPVEVDARADDFIRQFREQLRLQRLDSILRYTDTLRRTGTV